MLRYRPSGRHLRVLRRKSAADPAQDADARGPTGESTCLRGRRLQVRVLPGVLCPKQKRAMRRDVAPEKQKVQGSSPWSRTEEDHPGNPLSGTLEERRNQP
jgi:hypothetical protein